MARLVALVLFSAALALSACGGDGDQDEEAAPVETTATAEAPAVDVAPIESALKKELDGLKLLGAPALLYPPGGGQPEQTEIGGGRLVVRAVSCPEDVELEKGETFSCQIDARKGEGSVQLTQLDAEGKRFSYRAKLTTEAAGVSSETKVTGKIIVG